MIVEEGTNRILVKMARHGSLTLITVSGGLIISLVLTCLTLMMMTEMLIQRMRTKADDSRYIAKISKYQY